MATSPRSSGAGSTSRKPRGVRASRPFNQRQRSSRRLHLRRHQDRRDAQQKQSSRKCPCHHGLQSTALAGVELQETKQVHTRTRAWTSAGRGDEDLEVEPGSDPRQRRASRAAGQLQAGQRRGRARFRAGQHRVAGSGGAAEVPARFLAQRFQRRGDRFQRYRWLSLICVSSRCSFVVLLLCHCQSFPMRQCSSAALAEFC